MKLAVYGTLRTDEYNWRKIRAAYGKDSMKYLGRSRLYGFQLYLSEWGYPIAIPALDKVEINNEGKVSIKKHAITVEIFEVNDAALMAIDRMEKNARYIPVAVDVPSAVGKTRCLMYAMLSLAQLIPDGDWCEYNKNLSEEDINEILQAS